MVVTCGLSFNAYAALYELSCSMIHLGSKTDIRVDNVRVPKFLASPVAVKAKCKELYELSSFGESQIEITDGIHLGYQQSVKAFIDYAIGTDRFSQLIIKNNIKNSTSALEIVLNCDALPVGGGSAWICSLSLGNLGPLSKSIYGRYVCNISNINDKSSFNATMKCMWGENLEFISELAESKRYTYTNPISNESFECDVKVVFGGDDSNNRNLKGLNSNSSTLFCSCCYHTRADWVANKDDFVERTEELAEQKFAENNVTETSQLNLPMVKYVLFFPNSLILIYEMFDSFF